MCPTRPFARNPSSRRLSCGLVEGRAPSRRVARAVLSAGLWLSSCAAPGERAVTTYVGVYSMNSLPEEILPLRSIQFEDSHLVTLAYAEPFHKFWDEGGAWEWEVQGVKHWGLQDHWEFNALLAVRWSRFPWNEHVRTSFAVGDGLSWASEIPVLEAAEHPDEAAAQLLNYVLIECTLGMPSQEAWDFVFRIHHRSGVYGLFDGVDGGSNVLALGLKFRY